MGLLGKPLGIFSLKESDKYVGSFISREDIKEILSVNDDDLCDVKFKVIDGTEYIDEAVLRKEYWENGLIPNALPSKIGNTSISFDEYILMSIIRQTYPSAKVHSQYKWGRKYIDIYVEDGDRKYFIEFHGPGHFKKLSVYRDPEDPFIRKRAIEEEFKIPCYIWPYWIQLCASNLKILLGDTNDDERGYGALWSTKVFFSEFFFDNSAQIITEISDQFRAMPDGFSGYFYDEWGDEIGKVKEQHPIVERILKGRKSADILIPKGAKSQDRNKWLPVALQKST